MKEKIKTFLCVCLLMGALPYILTLMFQGKTTTDDSVETGKNITEDKDASAALDLDLETYLAGIVAKEVPITFEEETLKAQTVIARTNLLDTIEKGEKPPQSLSQEEMLSIWGEKGFSQNYKRVTEAIGATKGKVLTCEGEYIYAAYHSISAGTTRNAKDSFGYEKMPWLEAVESSADISAEDFLNVIFFTPEEIKEKLLEVFPELELPESDLLEYIKIEERDSQEYVKVVKLSEQTMTGEEFRELLDLNSACFYLAQVEDKIRIVTKGLGHGLGLSQYGANEMAKSGKDYQEILKYYYKNIEISD